MKRTSIIFAALSLAAVFAATTFGQTASNGQYGPHKDQNQINRLINSARTPEDHQRLAEYYRDRARYFENQSRAYGEKIAAYKRTPYLNSCAMCVTSSYSLEAAVKSLRLGKQMAEERAAEMEKLAIMHERMASIAAPPSSSNGL
jgi:hypothetical protein